MQHGRARSSTRSQQQRTANRVPATQRHAAEAGDDLGRPSRRRRLRPVWLRAHFHSKAGMRLFPSGTWPPLPIATASYTSSDRHNYSAIDQNSRPPIVKGGSPPKKRHMRSLPPFALHLKYAPKSGSDWKPSCSITPPLLSEGNLPETVLPRYVPMIGPSDDSALNPGMFISTS